MNINLRLAILETVRTQTKLSALTQIREERLSKIVNDWIEPTGRERELISAALGKSQAQLFKPRPTECGIRS